MVRNRYVSWTGSVALSPVSALGRQAYLEESKTADVDCLCVVVCRVVAADGRLSAAAELAHQAPQLGVHCGAASRA